MPTQVTLPKITTTTLLVLAVSVLVVLDILFLSLVKSQSGSVVLLKNQLRTLKKDEEIVKSGNDLNRRFQDEIVQISSVFPNEETITDFVQTLEALAKSNSDEYSFKFISITPLKEQDVQAIPISVSLKTDLPRLINLLDNLETLPFMTHVSTITSKTPRNIVGPQETIISLKVYVQNPFSQK